MNKVYWKCILYFFVFIALNVAVEANELSKTVYKGSAQNSDYKAR